MYIYINICCISHSLPQQALAKLVAVSGKAASYFKKDDDAPPGTSFMHTMYERRIQYGGVHYIYIEREREGERERERESERDLSIYIMIPLYHKANPKLYVLTVP
jgi:hypothetical protein